LNEELLSKTDLLNNGVGIVPQRRR
jgi:hypothetical protein